MNIYWIAHTITNPATWKKFSFFDGVRVTWGWDKLYRNNAKLFAKYMESVNYNVWSNRDINWSIPVSQIALAKRENQQVVASIMPEVKIGLPHFENYCKQLKKHFGKETIITWGLGTEPTIVADYDYKQYLEYYKIATSIFDDSRIFTAPGYTLISDKEFEKFEEFVYAWTIPECLSIHLYGSSNHRKRMLNKLRHRKPLWITETGWSSERKWWHWFARTNGEKEQLKQAKHDLQMYKDMGIKVVILYNWKDDPKAKNKFCRHAGLLRADGTEKPLFDHLKERYG